MTKNNTFKRTKDSISLNTKTKNITSFHKKIGDIISSKRKEKGLSQIELAKALEKYDIHIKNAAISSWEKNINTPTATQLLALCQIFQITDVYSEFIGENPYDPFIGLNAEGKSRALEYISLLKLSPSYSTTGSVPDLSSNIGVYPKKSANTNISPVPLRRMKIALIPSSAGTGNYLDEENFEEMDIYEPVPAKASFGVHLSGNSMEPQFQDGELVWIEQTEQLQTGEIGLFYLNGMTYFKKYKVTKDRIYLLSLNTKYKPIPVEESDTFKIFGRLTTEV